MSDSTTETEINVYNYVIFIWFSNIMSHKTVGFGPKSDENKECKLLIFNYAAQALRDMFPVTEINDPNNINALIDELGFRNIEEVIIYMQMNRDALLKQHKETPLDLAVLKQDLIAAELIRVFSN